MKKPPAVASYLEQITGAPPAMRDLAASETRKVPLYLRSAYGFTEVTLLSKRLVLASQREGQGNTTPGEYATHVGLLHKALGADVALVLPMLPGYTRNRLIRQGVAFVVPGHQMFLPFLALDLREREARAPHEPREILSAAAHATLLLELLHHSVQGRPLKDVAAALGYTAMTMTNVANELETTGLCEVVKQARTRQLVFTAKGRELWDRVLPRLRSPVRTRMWIRLPSPNRLPMMSAGTTALERYTAIAGDRLPTFAIWQNEYRRRLGRKQLIVCKVVDDADAALECWTYDPARLTKGGTVDRLSLYLSLRDSHDERVQKELKAMLEGMKW
jgi:DNA-binding MarR family transcriptional regulator